MTAQRPLRAATRGSKLALWQTHYVASLLGVPVEPVVIETRGDLNRNVPIEAMSGQGVFVKEVQQAVIDGIADFAVHSAKDLTSVTAPGLHLAAVPERGDARDALVGCSLEQLPSGARVATGSVRRRAQLASLRPDITFAGLRGNVDTRLAKAAEFDAIVSAYAPLIRLERMDVEAYPLDPSVFLPQVGQGALAIECREGDERTAAVLAAIEHAESRRAVDAERSFLATLGGGCDVPVGAYAVIDDGEVSMQCLIASMDGRIMLRRRGRSSDGVALGRELATMLMERDGGSQLLVANSVS
jgi:hydroxymethylbilane synthase